MHRLANQICEDGQQEVVLIEQIGAPVLFLTSASTDISSLDQAINLKANKTWKNKIRALLINELEHNAKIDHYINTTASESEIILIRLLGGKSHWSYGLEQLQLWSREKKERELIVISGTQENQIALHELSTIPIDIVDFVAYLLRVGGIENMTTFLDIIYKLRNNKELNILDYNVKYHEDPYKWDWRKNNDCKVGIILYNSLLKANDIIFAKQLNKLLRASGLEPRSLWISSLKDHKVANKVLKIFQSENIEAIITTTSFYSNIISDKGNEYNLWQELNLPVFQFLISSMSKKYWDNSSLGLNSTDLTLQIALPELDGRITTRPIAFKEIHKSNSSLDTSIKKLLPLNNSISWSIDLLKNWLTLRKLNNSDKYISIILANYPVRNGRLANGVGLDTPASLLEILKLLRLQGYDLGQEKLPDSSIDLMSSILSRRTNDPESSHREPLDYLSLESYISNWKKINEESKLKIISRWNTPDLAEDLEEKGFAIHGIRYGKVSILIQPSRGYDPYSKSDLHSPDLPPPHRYLAQYIWIDKVQKSNAMIHLGKHGSVEWLPGKGVGLSNKCFPHIVLPPLPNIYPFIVNDPGEGSQAKRRTQAVIIDHLTPPLGRSELYGSLMRLESIIDEYYESKLLSSERTDVLLKMIKEEIQNEEFPFLNNNSLLSENDIDFDSVISEVEGYLCEIKESQIRTGLHIFGTLPKKEKLSELALSIARAPQNNCLGLTEKVSRLLKFEINPWLENEDDLAIKEDIDLYKLITNKTIRKKGEIIAYIEEQSLLVIKHILNTKVSETINEFPNGINKHIIKYLKDRKGLEDISTLIEPVIRKINQSCSDELLNLGRSLNGEYINSGPSGAPTRGRIDVLPTGRNFYSVDMRNIPTEASWRLGSMSAQQILDLYLMENGEYLTHLAISVWGTATMRNGGEDISQILALMGVRPVWDYASKRIIDLEVIPLSILNRPRVDILVRISGFFRDAFPQIVELINTAQLKLSLLKESPSINPYINNDNSEFIGRVFGSAPGSYGAGLQEIISSSTWDEKSELVDTYINWSKWRYTGKGNPEDRKDNFKEYLSKVQLVLQNQDNKEHDILDSDDYYQFHGGLTASVEKLRGIKPTTLIADHSRSSRPRINTLRKEIDKVVRSRLLNPKWIEGVKEHGYKGAFEIGATVDYLFGYDATTNEVKDWCYLNIYKTFLKDDQNRSFLEINNPWVMRDIAERLLEASNRELWKIEDESIISSIQELALKADSIIEQLD
ncbi:cobaltochelatase subunit CobN [Prochlorococcus sp. MIT 1223]|uniref:cobaltochelatase subunit CobN n=1 Tax=Prochlorococcus sp. MIT 1223 TaxID=3096217 RepID=UPI002A74D8C0|nr:cobaltochelatase subunit CobN [Prochlorococcus sp. MIT 1223]